MLFLTEDANLNCKHQLGKVSIRATQGLVSINGRSVLVGKGLPAHPNGDPEKRPIKGCPNYGPSIKPCTTTLIATKGYSSLLSVFGRAVCLDSITGLTDGTPPGAVEYNVRKPGQSLVSQT